MGNRTRAVVGWLATAWVVAGPVAGGLAWWLAARPRLAPLAVAPASGSTHLALPGRVTILKAIVPPRPGHLLRYRWEYGDGEVGPEQPVKDPWALSTMHRYPVAEPGQRFEARLRLYDATSGESAEAIYPVEVVAPTLETRSAVALDDALWALHASMQRIDDPVLGRMGVWDRGGRHPLGTTAMCTLAFLVNGFDLRPERAGHPYTETVERGLGYIASRLQPVELPEGGRRLSVSGDLAMYELPLVVMALVAAQAPDRPLPGCHPAVQGRSTRAVVRELLATIVAAQRGAESGQDAGGWRYHVKGTNADMSVTQWPALALRAAEEVWGIEVPEATRAALEGYLTRAQRPSGGFGYVPGYADKVGLTGAGLIGLACAGVPGDDRRVKAASAFIASAWAQENVGDYYAMYAVMKGALLTSQPIVRFGEHDWRAEYVQHLASAQRQDGTWKEDGQWATGTLATAWPALILADDVFCSARPLDWRPLVWAAASAGAAWFLASAWVLRRLWRWVP